MKITWQWLHQHGTKGKGWTKAQVAVLGVSWPLERGWLKCLIGKEITDQQALDFMARGPTGVPGPTPKKRDSQSGNHWRRVWASRSGPCGLCEVVIQFGEDIAEETRQRRPLRFHWTCFERTYHPATVEIARHWTESEGV